MVRLDANEAGSVPHQRVWLRWTRGAVLGVLLGPWFGGCAEPVDEETAPPRLVFVHASCSLRADYLSAYDGGVETTPRLGRFASESLVFERHVTEAGQSGTAYASIFSGRHADGHGVFRHPTPISSEIPLLTSVFRDGGFYVEAWLSQVMASGELGYGRGAHRVHSEPLLAGDPHFLRLLSTLRDRPEARAFVLSTEYIVHSPYQDRHLDSFCERFPARCSLREENPTRFRDAVALYQEHYFELSNDLPLAKQRFGLGEGDLDYLARVVDLLYRSNVWRLDQHLGELLDAIDAHGLAEESLVVLTADHGEALYRDDLVFPWTHGYELAPEVLHVPLLVRGPGIGAGRYSSVTRSTDVLPTVAALAGLPVPPSPDEPWNGVDLSDAVRSRDAEPDLEAYSHLALFAEADLEAGAKWRLSRQWLPRLDPDMMWTQVRRGDSVLQLRGRRAEGRVRLEPRRSGPSMADEEAVEQRLRDYRRRLIDAWHARPTSPEGLDEARQIELLRSLGYVE